MRSSTVGSEGCDLCGSRFFTKKPYRVGIEKTMRTGKNSIDVRSHDLACLMIDD